MNNAAACQTNRKGFIVGVSEGDNTAWLFARQDGKRFGDNGAFYAPTTDRTAHFSIGIDCHGGTSSARARTLDINDAGDCNALASCTPLVEVVEKFTHD
jgi:hypothetical protein